jgi:hypothetical protein
MAQSRYRNVNLLDERKFYETGDFPSQELLDAIPTFSIVASRFDRLDVLAFRHLGAGQYWWIIALMNNIDWCFSFQEGQILKIPIDVQEVLRLF